MRVTFLLYGAGRQPVGGFKVVYEYANRLAQRDHDVTVVHTGRAERAASLVRTVRGHASFLVRRLAGAHGPSPWFRLDDRVRSIWVPSLDPRHIPDADAIVATAWQTAEWAAGYPAHKGRRYYLIQHLETWSGPEDRVKATWTMPLDKIVISRWLAEEARSLGEDAAYIPNGLDFEAFGVDRSPEARRRDAVLMLHHTLPWKGTADGLRALARVRERHPEALVQLFGTGPRPSDLPPEIRYHSNPPQAKLRELYNETAVFVAPSLAEGWPLPPAEALTSGCALVATDIGGHREYAISDRTALLSPPGDPEALAANILRLIEDDELRLRLARNGVEFIGQFTWDRAADAFEEVLGSGG